MLYSATADCGPMGYGDTCLALSRPAFTAVYLSLGRVSMPRIDRTERTCTARGCSVGGA